MLLNRKEYTLARIKKDVILIMMGLDEKKKWAYFRDWSYNRENTVSF
jgi:hypothetical protein